MLKLRDIMSEEVIVVSPEQTLRSVAELFVSERTSGAPVVASGRLLGVISTTDLLGFEADSAGVPVQRPEQVERGEGNAPAEWSEGDDPPALYFSEMWPDAGVDVLERFREPDQPEWDLLEEHTVSEVMTRQICRLPPDAGVSEAARYMVEADVHRILVVEGEEEPRLVGVVTTTDLVEAISEHGLSN